MIFTLYISSKIHNCNFNVKKTPDQNKNKQLTATNNTKPQHNRWLFVYEYISLNLDFS